jgi:hypothetical protein
LNVYIVVDCPQGRGSASQPTPPPSPPRAAPPAGSQAGRSGDTCYKVGLNSPVLQRHSKIICSAVYMVTGHRVCDPMARFTEPNVHAIIECPQGSPNGRAPCYKVRINNSVLRRHSKAMCSAVYLGTGHRVCDPMARFTESNVHVIIECPQGSLNRRAQDTCYKVSLNSPVLRRHSKAMCSVVYWVTGQRVCDPVARLPSPTLMLR